jgi:hypothetical protein
MCVGLLESLHVTVEYLGSEQVISAVSIQTEMQVHFIAITK